MVKTPALNIKTPVIHLLDGTWYRYAPKVKPDVNAYLTMFEPIYGL